jgi:hypothetical protein
VLHVVLEEDPSVATNIRGVLTLRNSGLGGDWEGRSGGRESRSWRGKIMARGKQ